MCFQELDSWLCYDKFSLLPTRVSTIEKRAKTPMCLCSKSITAVLKTIESSEKEVVPIYAYGQQIYFSCCLGFPRGHMVTIIRGF